MEKATHQQTKDHNRNLVLKTIFERECTSRADIARITSLTRTTVSDIVTGLIVEGLVCEIGVGSSIGGKSPILLSLMADSRCLIGLDLAQNQFRGAVVNLRGQIRELAQAPVGNRNGQDALDLVYDIIDSLLKCDCQPVVGIGIGTPGLVNTAEGVVVSAVNLDWNNLPLARLVEERYHLPVYVLNDSQAAAMGEYAYGAAIGNSDQSMVVINARHGIGAGIIVKGELFQGDGGGAGEIGHVVVVPEGGAPCRCGNFGCLETVASVQAIVRRAQMLGNSSQTLSLDEVLDAFHAGHPLARQVIFEAGRYLGVAIAGLVGVLNIQKIILTGDMTRFGEPWLNMVRATMAHSTLPRLAQESQVEIGLVSENGIILGASAVLLRDYALLFRQER
jgi:N-acetylglucosamine repressor